MNMVSNPHVLIENGVLPSDLLPLEVGFGKVSINQENFKPLSFTENNQTLLNFEEGA